MYVKRSREIWRRPVAAKGYHMPITKLSFSNVCPFDEVEFEFDPSRSMSSRGRTIRGSRRAMGAGGVVGLSLYNAVPIAPVR